MVFRRPLYIVRVGRGLVLTLVLMGRQLVVVAFLAIVGVWHRLAMCVCDVAATKSVERKGEPDIDR